MPSPTDFFFQLNVLLVLVFASHFEMWFQLWFLTLYIACIFCMVVGWGRTIQILSLGNDSLILYMNFCKSLYDVFCLEISSLALPTFFACQDGILKIVFLWNMVLSLQFSMFYYYCCAQLIFFCFVKHHIPVIRVFESLQPNVVKKVGPFSFHILTHLCLR